MGFAALHPPYVAAASAEICHEHLQYASRGMIGWPTSANLPRLEPVPSPGLGQAQGLPKNEGEFISVGFAALHPPYVAGQMRIAGDGAEIYKVSYVRGQYKAL